ncbi:Alpha-1,3-mannosyl-glycoprotein 2-beta-N-acetylglucosaminyltransferase, partial [Trichoplax sp. H2]
QTKTARTWPLISTDCYQDKKWRIDFICWIAIGKEENMKSRLLLAMAVTVFVVGNLYLLRSMLDNPNTNVNQYQDTGSLTDQVNHPKLSPKGSVKESPQPTPVDHFPKEKKQTIKNYTIAVLVIACNRPSVKRCVDLLFRNRPSATYYPIIVSQFNPSPAGGLSGYHKIARHYKWALDQVFNVLNYETVIIVEDDLDVAADFFSYFQATRHLMEKDKSIWCVSAWNDNGRKELTMSPGTGGNYSVINCTLYWDDWMREPARRQNRVCIRPEISRTRTFGRIGVSQGQFFDKYLKHININTGKVDFMSKDLSYLEKENYNSEFLETVNSSPVITFSQLLAETGPKDDIVRIKYKTEGSFVRIARRLGLMTDFKAGIPRTAYKGIVSFTYKNKWVHLVPSSAR